MAYVVVSRYVHEKSSGISRVFKDVIDKDPLVAEPYLVTTHFTFLILHLDLSLKVSPLIYPSRFFKSSTVR